jgi:hypothetical protein
MCSLKIARLRADFESAFGATTEELTPSGWVKYRLAPGKGGDWRVSVLFLPTPDGGEKAEVESVDQSGRRTRFRVDTLTDQPWWLLDQVRARLVALYADLCRPTPFELEEAKKILIGS